MSHYQSTSMFSWHPDTSLTPHKMSKRFTGLPATNENQTKQQAHPLPPLPSHIPSQGLRTSPEGVWGVFMSQPHLSHFNASREFLDLFPSKYTLPLYTSSIKWIEANISFKILTMPQRVSRKSAKTCLVLQCCCLSHQTPPLSGFPRMQMPKRYWSTPDLTLM